MSGERIHHVFTVENFLFCFRPFCQCKPGYTGLGTKCTEIDPCQAADHGGCHHQVMQLTAGGLSPTGKAADRGGCHQSVKLLT